MNAARLEQALRHARFAPENATVWRWFADGTAGTPIVKFELLADLNDQPAKATTPFDACEHLGAVDLRGSRVSPFLTVQHYFYRWRNTGVFECMLNALRGLAHTQAGRFGEPADDKQSIDFATHLLNASTNSGLSAICKPFRGCRLTTLPVRFPVAS